MSFSLLDEFKSAAGQTGVNKALAAMASAKWKTPLLTALISSDSKLSIESACDALETAATKVCAEFELDALDPTIKNFVLQAISVPAAEAIKSTGSISGDWLSRYIECIKSLPESLQTFSATKIAANSLAMTRTTHISELFAATNEFSFLQSPDAVVMQIDAVVTAQAKANTDELAKSGDATPIYQNQLNRLRELYISIYRAESNKHWLPMLEKEPDFRNLFTDGIPLDGVNQRFKEQVAVMNRMLGISQQENNVVKRVM